jgi:hypothetical protein
VNYDRAHEVPGEFRISCHADPGAPDATLNSFSRTSDRAIPDTSTIFVITIAIANDAS